MKLISNSLTSSSTYRVGMVMLLVVVVCISLSGIFSFHFIKNSLHNELDEVLLSQFEKMSVVYKESGLQDLIRFSHLTGPSNLMEHSIGFQITDEKGQIVTGSMPSFESQSGFQTIKGAELGPAYTSNYRTFTGYIGDRKVSVGSSLRVLSHITFSFLLLFLVTLFLTLSLTLFVLYLMSRKYVKRGVKIDRFFEGVGQGNLKSRLPVGVAGDDIDHHSMLINSAIASLEQRVSAMSQATSHIAHDLKMPIHRLYVKLSDALSRVDEEDPLYEIIEGASNEAFQAAGTFDALLRISQIQSGVKKERFCKLDLRDLINRVYEIYEYVVLDNNQNLVLEVDDKPACILGDDNLIFQLIINLVENAIRYCPDNTQITIGVVNSEDGVILHVADNGPGIPKADRELVFDRFYRGKQTESTAGSGIGLFLARSIVDLHDAKIQLSDSDPGLLVQITFPASN